MELLVVDHWVHLSGILPYLLLPAGLPMHVFMHGRHRHQHHGNDDTLHRTACAGRLHLAAQCMFAYKLRAWV